MASDKRFKLALIPRSTSYSPGPAAPIPPFRPGYTEYVQASKLIDTIEDGVKTLVLDWVIERIDGSHVQPYRENVAFKRNRLADIAKESENAIAVEIGFGSAGPKPQQEKSNCENNPEVKQIEGKTQFPASRPGSGIRTVHKIGCDKSALLAKAIHGELVKIIPIPDRGIGAPKNELLDTCKIPICQIRPLFIDGGVDPHYLKFARSRTFMASAIIEGIKKYLEAQKTIKQELEKKPEEKPCCNGKEANCCNGKSVLTHKMKIPDSIKVIKNAT